MTTIEALTEAVRSPNFSHVRSRKWCGVWQAHIYHLDPTSPSGVTLAATGMDEEVSMVLIACGKSAALSPTEAR